MTTLLDSLQASIAVSTANPEATVLDTLNGLARKLHAAKSEEEAATRARIAVEQELIAAVAFSKQEGQQTYKTGECSITIKGSLIRKLDFKLWQVIEPDFPADLRPVKLVPKLDETGVKWLEKNRPDLYAVLAPALEVKPAKTAVELKFAA